MWRFILYFFFHCFLLCWRRFSGFIESVFEVCVEAAKTIGQPTTYALDIWDELSEGIYSGRKGLAKFSNKYFPSAPLFLLLFFSLRVLVHFGKIKYNSQ